MNNISMTPNQYRSSERMYHNEFLPYEHHQSEPCQRYDYSETPAPNLCIQRDDTFQSVLKKVDKSFKRTIEFTQNITTSDEFKAIISGAKSVAAYGTATVAGVLSGGVSGAINGGSTGYQLGKALLQTASSMQDGLTLNPKQQQAYKILTGAANLALGAVGAMIGLGVGIIGGAINGFQNYQACQAVWPAIRQSFSDAFQACSSARVGAVAVTNS